ncbi:putative disease resistance protein At1g50180 [Magnolia sinica]|uniref:putative disease resistance protein At1g50180 n=1 Tax=Magnolia sinica TaxID=86752 RepID=UPI00265875CF|nr:putative disease resistance protein At1g50180 [Magnolia sinica]
MALVESVVELLLQKLADPLIREAILLHGVGDQVQWLEDEFGRMKRFLKDADAKQEGDERVKGWVGDVRDVAYDAEDVIDTFVFKVANLRRTGFVGCIKRYACIFNELLARHQVGWKIERIKGKISEISESRLTYGIENIGEGAGTSSADAEDVIDTLVFKVANLRRTRFVGCIKRYACIFNELIARHEVGSKIERLKIKIHAISQSRSTYGIENIGQGAGTSYAGRSHQEWRRTSPYVQEPDFVGFDNDLKALVTQLTNEGELRRCVVSVVGMGGLGKTTLTRKVYNTDSVKKHFHTHAWISISQQPSVKDILQVLVRHWMVVSDNTAEKLHIAELRDKISGYLIDKRYLVVLDDIWKREAWDALKDAFPDVKNGSRVMLTTRIKDLASYADQQREPHELRFLTNEESWDLLCKKTFVGQDGGCPQDLEKLGREIVEKCHGLPLAIAVVGGLLSGKKLFNEWENVCKSISWQLGQSEVQISSILSLSYKDLPYDLKPCFLYLAKFPEDYEFKAKELIQLWAAEGFLKERGELTLEEVGEDNLMQLVQRSMVQVARRSSSKGIKSCRIHDLLRDLSISEAKESKFLEVQFLKVQDDNGNATPAASRARRLAIYIISRGELHPKEWRVEEGAMPSLLHLRIHDCKQLKKLPEGLQHVTTLKKLELWSMPAEFKARVEEDRREDWYKIRHIPSIDIHDSYRIGS